MSDVQTEAVTGRNPRLRECVMNATAILAKHQGPFFSGTGSRCQCGHPVKSAEEWAAHVNQKLEDGAQ